MKSSATFSILFWIYTKREVEGQADVYARITVNGKRANISLKRKIDLSKWDSKKQRLKGNGQTSREINKYLDGVYSKLFQCYQDLTFKGELVTAQLIKSNFCGETESFKTLQGLISYHNRKIENTLSKGTVKNFGITEGYIKKFLNNVLNTSDIYLNQLDYKFICEFEDYLHLYWPKGHPKAMGQNTVMKHLQRLRKIVTLGYHMEWIVKDPFIRWKPSWERTNRTFLSLEELTRIENYEFISDRLDRVRDLFVFSCYTGISYIDIMKLTSENIQTEYDGENWIITKRQKNNNPVKVPLLPFAKILVEKYEDNPICGITGTLFPVITNEKLNSYLKEVAERCDISKNLTFHMARHTFATTVTLCNGVPIETVSKLLGHNKISTTQIYAKVVEQKVSEDMKKLKETLSKKSKFKMTVVK